MHRLLRTVRAGGSGPPEAILEGLLKGVAAGGVIAAVAGTESGTSIRFPNTEVTEASDGSLLLNGHKIFGTLSPIATVLFSQARLADGNGGYEGVLCMVLRGMEGVDIKDNWDAIGMRASGSNDVVYKDVKLPATNVVRSGQPLGEVTLGGGDPGVGNLGLLGAFVGIAEAAADMVAESVKTRRKGPSNTTLAERQWMQHLIGEMEVDVYACRATLSHFASTVDDFVARYPKQDAPAAEAEELDRQHQAAKYIINRRAIDAVDKALTASGGAGYMSKHPLSRMYRDVRAGPFMQPYSPAEALEFIGRVTLDQPPSGDF
jgi:alkylation response protein AidB-like acyl-CoA dehydrogenase